MAAGWPCAALAGRRDLFADVATGAVTHAGTFNGNTVATAAVLASLDELASGEVYERVSQVGTALMQSIRSCAAATPPDPRTAGLPVPAPATSAGPGPPMTRYSQLQHSDPDRYGRLAGTRI